MDLKKLLNKQVNLAWFQMITYVVILIGMIVIFTAAKKDEYGDYVSSGGATAGIAIIVVGWISFIVLWILGIVNAAKVNTVTHSSTVLIVFAVLTLFIAHVIVAHVEKSKYDKLMQRKEEDKVLDVELEIAFAKKDLKEGKITLDEYNSRLDKIQEEINKK